MNRIITLAISVLIIAILSITLVHFPSGDHSTDHQDMQMILANRPDLWERGLHGYPQLDDTHGILFDFGGVDKRCLWNKGISYPVDVAFYDLKWHLLGGETMDANSEKIICSPSPVRYVIEVRGGWFRSHSVK